MPPKPSPITLDYAKSPSRRQILRRIFRITLLAAVIIAAATSTRWAPPAWHRAQLLYYQRQCLNYTAPPDQIVFECDQVFLNIANHTNPACFAKLQQLLPPTVPRNSIPFAVPVLLTPAGHTFSTTNDSISFLHQRRSRSGNTRLVVVGNVFGSLDYDTCVPTGVFGQSPYVEGECILFGIRPQLLDSKDTDGDGIADYQFHIRVYAGQPDQSDQSHFTIRYEINNQKDIIDGYLQDDGTVKLTCRAGDSTRPFNFSNPAASNIPKSEDLTSDIPLKIIPPRLAPGDLIDDTPRRR